MEKVFNQRNPYKLLDETRKDLKVWKGGEELHLKAGDAVEKFGYQWIWTEWHKSPQQLDKLRNISDDYADTVLQQLSFKPDQDTLTECIERAEKEGGVFKEFLDQVENVPTWVDWERIQRGQELFIRNFSGCFLALLYLSLVGGFGAPKINKVLTATGYLANKNTFRRLVETTQMIVDCMMPDGLVPHKGVGWFSSLRVRFLHAKVRSRLKNSQKWKTEEWGVPINQEDMIATILSFQFNVIFCLSVIGIPLTNQEVEDYTHLWRYIGYLSGVREDLNPCDNFLKTKAIQESIFWHLVEPDDSSVYLANHVITAMDEPGVPIKWPMKAHQQMARMFLREDLSALLQLPESKWYYYHHLIFFAMLRASTRMTYLPLIGPVMIKYNKEMMQRIIAQLLGSRTEFAMSHVPSDESIDNLTALKDENARWKGLKSMKRMPFVYRFLIVLACLYIFQKFLGAPFLARMLKS